MKCACGCGLDTPLAKATRSRLGHVAGQPTRYVQGHGRWAAYAERRAAHFWERVLDAPSGCREWQGRTDRKGYGRVGFDGKNWAAHRLAYELARGPIPDGLTIDHLCANKRCVNPDHLEPVTARENTRRAAAAFLSDEARKAIATDPRKQRVIAAEYGISQTTVWRIALAYRAMQWDAA